MDYKNALQIEMQAAKKRAAATYLRSEISLKTTISDLIAMVNEDKELVKAAGELTLGEVLDKGYADGKQERRKVDRDAVKKQVVELLKSSENGELPVYDIKKHLPDMDNRSWSHIRQELIDEKKVEQKGERKGSSLKLK